MKRILTFKQSNYDIKEVTIKMSKEEFYEFMGFIQSLGDELERKDKDYFSYEVSYIAKFMYQMKDFKSKWVK